MRRSALYILAVVQLLLPLAADSLALEVLYEYPEARIEAAFVFNFAKFVTWPEAAFPSPRSPLVLAVLDLEMYEAARDTLAGRTVQGHSLEIRMISRPDQIDGSHVLFIGSGAAARVEEFQPAMRGGPLLTIGAFDGFIDRGGMIELFKSERKIRFGVHLQTVRTAGLKISSEVLQLAAFVRGG
jgi:hypothetical protein